MRKRASGDREAKVGIFWLLPGGRLIFDVTPVSAAEEYGNALTHPRSHLAHWTTLQRSGQVSPEIEYERYPRGRVSFFPLENKFALFADACILKERVVLRRIIKTMQLPTDRTEAGRDDHYRCARCMASAMDVL